jgi:hypothetical protein
MASRVITISLKEEVEKELRKLAMQKYSRKKGALAKIVEEGVLEVAKKEKMDPGSARILAIMKELEGKGYGGLKKYKREELYER